MNSRLLPPEIVDLADVDPIDVIRSVLAESGSVARLMEIHYLASEPELFAIMQAVAGLSPADRAALAAFLNGAAGSGITVAKSGRRVLEMVKKLGPEN